MSGGNAYAIFKRLSPSFASFIHLEKMDLKIPMCSWNSTQTSGYIAEKNEW
ncbi:Uncharacterized protein FKW44_008860 [Caligus rogercresseyi]|uniref:Uncharacterized protein n=1 Tax=Caligus rogercresseyi TaxID=217165 RepID=A0A7T8QUJ5_CALRO|nr:Uncharacterized protein FKW44_008860 [Caligus rogercresseyi]